MWLWLAQTAAMSLLTVKAMREELRARAEAVSWRHRAAEAGAALDRVAEQVGAWRCACGHILTSQDTPHMCAGVRHTRDRCVPLDDA